MKKYVKIKSANNDYLWYSNKIGRTYELHTNTSVYVKGQLGKAHMVLKEDCEMVENAISKDDLKIGMTVQLRNGDLLRVSHDHYISNSKTGVPVIEYYDDDLLSRVTGKEDIIKVWWADELLYEESPSQDENRWNWVIECNYF